ncbi:uncharacterized protein TNCV_4958581 [Trichonephila clavipes]|nr:uncharacterized protein TNCV_4958581 [Trichonephila clavipes]
MGEDYRPSRSRIFLSRNRSSCAVEQFHSDASLEVVNRRAPKNWKTGGGRQKALSISRRLLHRGLLASDTGSPSRQTIDGYVSNGLMSTEPGQADWHQVVFLEESRFNLWDHDDLICVRRYADERCLPEYFIERYSGLTPRVMVWGYFLSWTIQFATN